VLICGLLGAAFFGGVFGFLVGFGVLAVLVAVLAALWRSGSGVMAALWESLLRSGIKRAARVTIKEPQSQPQLIGARG